MKTRENIGCMVYWLRNVRGLTQQRLAGEAEIARPALTNIELGKPKGFSQKQLLKITETLKFDALSLEDEDLYSYLPKELQTKVAFAICSIIDAYFASIDPWLSGRFIRQFFETGVDVSGYFYGPERQEPRKRVGYVLSSTVYDAIKLKGLEKYFKLPEFPEGWDRHYKRESRIAKDPESFSVHDIIDYILFSSWPYGSYDIFDSLANTFGIEFINPFKVLREVNDVISIEAWPNIISEMQEIILAAEERAGLISDVEHVLESRIMSLKQKIITTQYADLSTEHIDNIICEMNKMIEIYQRKKAEIDKASTPGTSE